jgi:hypothetical protein
MAAIHEVMASIFCGRRSRLGAAQRLPPSRHERLRGDDPAGVTLDALAANSGAPDPRVLAEEEARGRITGPAANSYELAPAAFPAKTLQASRRSTPSDCPVSGVPDAKTLGLGSADEETANDQRLLAIRHLAPEITRATSRSPPATATSSTADPGCSSSGSPATHKSAHRRTRVSSASAVFTRDPSVGVVLLRGPTRKAADRRRPRADRITAAGDE